MLILALSRASYEAEARYVTILLDCGSLMRIPVFLGMIVFKDGTFSFAAITASLHLLDVGFALHLLVGAESYQDGLHCTHLY